MKKFLLILLLLIIPYFAYAESNYESGVAAYNAGNYPNAQKYLELALREQPNNNEVRYWYAHSLVKNNQISKAKENYQIIVSKEPYSKLGQNAIQSINSLNNQIKSDAALNYQYGEPDYVKNAYTSGKLYRWEKLPIKVYIPENSNKTLVHRAFLEWQAKTGGAVSFITVAKEEDANITIKFVDEIDKKQYGTAYKAGLASSKFQGDYFKSSNIDILTVMPSGAKVPPNIIYGTVLHEIGHSIGIGGHSTNNDDIMSTANENMGSRLTARDIRTAKLIYSSKPPQHSETAIAKSQINESKDFIKKTPTNPEGWVDLGKVYYNAQKYDAAIKCYQEAVKLDAKYGIAYANAADAYAMAGKSDTAAAYAKRAVSLNPESPKYLASLLNAYQKQNNHPEAKRILTDYLRKNNDKKYCSELKQYTLYYRLNNLKPQ